MQAWHLTKRFFSSLRPRAPREAEEDWLVSMLSRSEEQLYRRQSVVDRCHSIDCALAAREALGARASHHVVVASALHDVGKADAGLGTVARVAATVLGAAMGESRMRQWEKLDGVRGRVGRYARHDERGAALLMQAGSHPLVVAWAREHHEPRRSWSIERDIAEVLHRADR